jgi:hypothetical protein
VVQPGAMKAGEKVGDGACGRGLRRAGGGAFESWQKGEGDAVEVDDVGEAGADQPRRTIGRSSLDESKREGCADAGIEQLHCAIEVASGARRATGRQRAIDKAAQSRSLADDEKRDFAGPDRRGQLSPEHFDGAGVFERLAGGQTPRILDEDGEPVAPWVDRGRAQR